MQRAAQVGETTLTQWFAQNAADEEARQYLYAEFPEHYRWVNEGGQKHWRKYRRPTRVGAIGRMYLTTPRTFFGAFHNSVDAGT